MSDQAYGFIATAQLNQPLYQPLNNIISLLPELTQLDVYTNTLPNPNNILSRISHVFDELAQNVVSCQGIIYGQAVANLFDPMSRAKNIPADATHIDIFLPKQNMTKFLKLIKVLTPTLTQLPWVDKSYDVYTINIGKLCQVPLVITTKSDLKFDYYNHLLSWDGKMVRLILTQPMLADEFDFYTTIETIRWLNCNGYLAKINPESNQVLERYFLASGFKLLN